MSNADREMLTEQRKRYMNNELTFDEYYTWLAGFIGATHRLVPFTAEQVHASTDQHLNDLPLAAWDRMDPIVRHLAAYKGLPWSLSDTVCVLKTLARTM